MIIVCEAFDRISPRRAGRLARSACAREAGPKVTSGSSTVNFVLDRWLSYFVFEILDLSILESWLRLYLMGNVRISLFEILDL